MNYDDTIFSLPGRVLFLCNDPELIADQLRGRDIDLISAGSLRDDISTDEITPVPILTHYDQKLARYPYTGLSVSGRRPIGVGAILESKFSVVVAGSRYGKGSSREHSPAAEKLAGVRLIIAESFERIYRQNADNIGLITSTDFSLVERIQRGEPIALAELLAGRDTLAKGILQEGGLLPFGKRTMQSVQAASKLNPGPRTLFEKIIARYALRTSYTDASTKPGDGVFVRAHWRFIHEYYTGMCAHMLHTAFGRPLKLHEPETIVVFEDHTSYVATSPAHVNNGLVPNVLAMCEAQRRFVNDYGLTFHRTLTDKEAEVEDGSNVAGISHAMVIERYALPGQLVIGTDSHTPHSGALGCVAFGVGTTDMANAFMTGAARLTVPESLKVLLDGSLSAGVTAKDVVLHLLAQPAIRAGAGIGKVFEFMGEAVSALSVDERATLTNMTAELGGLTGIVAPDERTVEFLRERRGIEFVVESWMCSDELAAYSQVIHIDCSTLTPFVAAPGDPGHGIPLSQLQERVKIDIAYGGSCTAGKREDFDHYHEVLSWAAQRGLRVHPTVQLYLQYGTTAVRDYCNRQGYEKVFAQVGAKILQPSCGACANCGPGSSVRADQVSVSAINRNFPGRSGPGAVWLASAPTVAASAIAGQLVSFEDLRGQVPV